MSRRNQAKKRDVLPDSKFNDIIVTKFINGLMVDGKKSVAENIFYSALEEIEKETNESGYEIFKKAMENVKPAVEVRSRRVGGANFQIPMPIRADRKISMAMKWLIKYASLRNDKSMAQKLAAEIIAASKEEGAAVKKKTDTHKMAEANKAFSHFKF